MFSSKSSLKNAVTKTMAGVVLVGVLLLPPIPSKADIIALIVTLAAVAGGGAIYDFNSCNFNIIWGCSGGGGGGGGGGAGGGTTITTPPSPPTIDDDDFYANPSLVQNGSNTKLYWNVSDADSCTVTGGGLSHTDTNFGEVDTNAIENSTVFTLTCTNAGGSTSATTRVRPIPVYREI